MRESESLLERIPWLDQNRDAEATRQGEKMQKGGAPLRDAPPFSLRS